MNQTGQPLTDAGRAIAAVLAKKISIEDANTPELNAALSFLVSKTNPNKKTPGAVNNLKILPAFWQNNPLMGLNPGQLQAYQAKLNSLLGANVPSKNGHCQICGSSGVFSDVNRSWMPLAAGAEGDPCSLPNLRGKFLCADCFRSVVLLPLGCRFCKAGPYLFHLSDPELQVEAMKDGVETIQQAILTKTSGNAAFKEITRLSGRLELLEIVSGSLLWDTVRGGSLSRRPENGATIISFSNSGTSAAWNQLHLPAQALDFFAALTEAKLRPIFLGWAEKSRDLFYDALCDDIESRRSIAPILAALVRRRKDTERFLKSEEKQVLRIYEEVALDRSERFDTLEQIAKYVNEMDERYRESFVKQLSNTRTKEKFFLLLRSFAKDEKTKEQMRFTTEEWRVLETTFSSEVISLLYLLCVAKDA